MAGAVDQPVAFLEHGLEVGALGGGQRAVGLTPYLAIQLGVGPSERGPISLDDDRSMIAATRHGVAKTRPQENP